MIRRFTKGGQILAHGTRMFRQVIALLLLIFVFSFIISLSVYLYLNTEKTNWSGYQEYYLSKLFVIFGKYEQLINVYPNKSAKAITIINSTYWLNQVKLLENHIFKGIKISIKASSMVITMIGILFTIRGKRDEGEIHKRGSGLVSYKSLLKIITRDNRDYSAYRIAGIPYHYRHC